MRLPARRLTNGLGFLGCIGLLSYAYYAEHGLRLEPCPLCVFQRFGVAGVGVFFLLAALHNPSMLGSRIYAGLIGLAAMAGGGVAARHVWLQNLPPDEVPECGPGLAYILDVFPLSEAMRLVFSGSGECAEVDWTLVGLSMPAWVLICFIGLGTIGVARNWLSDAGG